MPACTTHPTLRDHGTTTSVQKRITGSNLFPFPFPFPFATFFSNSCIPHTSHLPLAELQGCPRWYTSARHHPKIASLTTPQTALFNFQSLLLVILLTICTSTYAHYVFPGIIDRNKDNYFVSPLWKAARVGERLSPYVSLACVVMAVSTPS